LSAKGVQVLGVSPDSVKKHQKFTEKHQLNFPLVADEDHSIGEAYGAWVEKSMYGRKYMGMERSTFVIDSAGVIRKTFRKVNIPGHVDEVAAAVEQL
jgi:peroxiredoxin Q/BCP